MSVVLGKVLVRHLVSRLAVLAIYRYAFAPPLAWQAAVLWFGFSCFTSFLGLCLTCWLCSLGKAFLLAGVRCVAGLLLLYLPNPSFKRDWLKPAP